MNKLFLGDPEVELPKGGCLLIDDEAREVGKWRRPQIFNPFDHSIDLFEDMTPRRAQEITALLYTISPEGENTLTVRNGKRALRKALLRAKSFDGVLDDNQIPKEMRSEVHGMVEDMLFSPVLKKVFCGRPNFVLKPSCVNMARINRAELGEDDALTLGLVLMSMFKGTIVLPDAGFYLRDLHRTLLLQDRLYLRVRFLDELPPKLRKEALRIKDRKVSGALYDDAEELAKHDGLAPDRLREDNEYNNAVKEAMA